MKSFSKLIKSSLVKNASVYAISTFINSGITVLLLPVLTRYLSTAEYGILSMINATISVVTPFVGMSISAAITRQMVDNDRDKNRRYVFNSFVILLVSTAITAVVFGCLSVYISKYTEIPQEYFSVIIIISVLDTWITTALGILQFNNKTFLYAIYRNMETILNVSLSILLIVFFKMDLSGRILAILIAKLIAAVIGIGIVNNFIGFQPKIDLVIIKDELFNYGIPMIPTLLKNTILTYLDRIFITNMKSVSETGLYTVGNQLALPILFCAQAFNLAYVPWLYKKLANDNQIEKRKIVKLTYIYFALILMISILWTVLATIIAKYIVGGEYAKSTMYIGYLAIGYAFMGMHMMVVNYIYYEKKVKLYNIVTLTVILSNVILNYIFISKNGSIGAAQATLLVNITSFILTWLLSAKVHKMPWNFRKVGC